MARVTTDDERFERVLARDAGADGEFVFAVRTTGVYCRPSCPSRHAKRANVRFFDTNAAAERAGFRACKRCTPDATSVQQRRAARIARACELLEQTDEPLPLAALARSVGGSPFRLQREFKAALGVSPREYAAARRDERARDGLSRSSSVIEAVHAAGYGSASRFYAQSNAHAGMSPRERRLGGEGAQVRYTMRATSLGALLVAATDKGLCDVRLGSDRDELERELRALYPHARLVRGDARFAEWVDGVVARIEEPAVAQALPIDVRGSAFQARVWKALQAIPCGTTLTYEDLAHALGSPKAARAVALACATNRVALVVPCHRVVRKGGGLGGYRWGVERKRELLKREANPRSASVVGSSHRK